MKAKNTLESYGWIMMLIHWIMAIMIIGMLIVGLYMVDLPLSPQKHKLYGYHKEIGILIFGLVWLRIFWRAMNVLPSLPPLMPRLEIIAARTTHYLLYLLMIGMPLTGWLMSSASGLPVSFFGLFVLPDLVSANEDLRVIFKKAHEIIGFGLIGLITLHTLAALKHHFFNKDDVLRKMLP